MGPQFTKLNSEDDGIYSEARIIKGKKKIKMRDGGNQERLGAWGMHSAGIKIEKWKQGL